MRDRMLYESAVSLLAAAVGVGLLVAIYSHLWLDTSGRAADRVLRFSDSVVVTRPTVESPRLVGAATTAVGLALLAVLSPQFADDLRSEARAGLVPGSWRVSPVARSRSSRQHSRRRRPDSPCSGAGCWRLSWG